MPFYDKVTKIVYTDQLWNLEWQPFVRRRSSNSSSLYAVMNSEKKVKISSPQQLITYYDNHGISVKSLTDLIDNQYIYQLIEVSATAYILNGKYCDYTIKRSSHSFNNLGEQLGINLSQFNRAKGNLKGVSDKEILFRLLKKRTESVQDHNGKQFKTVKDMLAYYGVSSSTFSHRKKKGLSLEECLTQPKSVQDHKGNRFATIKEMCEYYSISQASFLKRKRQGLSLEDCLAKKRVCDHKGNEFDTLGDMYAYYGISSSTFSHRKKKGLSLKECLAPTVVQDHKGNRFNTVKEMCEFYNISRDTFEDRRRKGFPLEECLTPPKAVVVQDHLGNQFNTEKEMHEYHGVSASTFYSRKKKGLSLEECLRPISHIRNHSK